MALELEKGTNMSNKPYKKLWRSRKDRKIAGICGGLGVYFGVDPVLIRILFIIFFLVGGTALIAYLILWLVIPLEPEDWQSLIK